MPSLHLSLTPLAAELLARQRNSSRYVDRLVERQALRLQRALDVLDFYDFSCDELQSLCEVLAASCGALKPSRHAELIRICPSAALERNISLSRWERMAEQMRESEEIANAVDAVACEYWSENTWLADQLRAAKETE